MGKNVALFLNALSQSLSLAKYISVATHHKCVLLQMKIKTNTLLHGCVYVFMNSLQNHFV